jgi:gas vesicle protein
MRFLLVFLLGLGAGVVVALFMTPQPGHVMRQVIAYKARERWQAAREGKRDTL